MIISPNYRISHAELATMIGEYQEVIEDEMYSVRRSLEWARDARTPELQASHMNFAGCHLRKAMDRHIHQKELVRMAYQKDAFCSFKVGSMVYTIGDEELKAHGVVIGIMPDYVRIYITHSNLTFFGGAIDVPREKALECWEFKYY
jgi:hypothetical protein